MRKKIILFLILFIAIIAVFSRSSYTIKKISRQALLPQDEMTGIYNYQSQDGEFEGKKVQSFPFETKLARHDEEVLGLMSQGQKRIEVDLTNQRLYAFEGDIKVYDFPISSGLYDWTPRGEFWVWIKLKYTLMKGGSKALGTYYYLPNVPYTMYFENNQIPRTRGFGIHGAYWHNDFGRPKSHGCINLIPSDAEKLYYWAQPDLQGKNSVRTTIDNPGTKIIIYGKYQY